MVKLDNLIYEGHGFLVRAPFERCRAILNGGIARACVRVPAIGELPVNTGVARGSHARVCAHRARPTLTEASFERELVLPPIKRVV